MRPERGREGHERHVQALGDGAQAGVGHPGVKRPSLGGGAARRLGQEILMESESPSPMMFRSIDEQ